MNKELKEKWLTALRSGEYKQGFNYLKKDDCHCALGVLCAIINDDWIAVDYKFFTGYMWKFGKSPSTFDMCKEARELAEIEYASMNKIINLNMANLARNC